MNDPVNHPGYYQINSTTELIDILEMLDLEAHEFCAVQYIFRAGKKNLATQQQDLEKAVWYLNRKIAKLAKRDKKQSTDIEYP